MNNGGTATPVTIARNLFRELHSVTEMIKRVEARPGGAPQGHRQVQGRGRHHRAGSLEAPQPVLQDLGVPEWSLDLQSPDNGA
jgi:hypothetical protein